MRIGTFLEHIHRCLWDIMAKYAVLHINFILYKVELHDYTLCIILK